MKQMRRACAAGLFAGAMLSGCAVGPDFHEPTAPATGTYTETPLPPVTVAAPGTTGGEAQRLVPGRDLPAEWWTLFRSEPLDSLIRAAVGDSPNLAAAQATLRQAQEEYNAGTGRLLFPQVDANVGATREKILRRRARQPDARHQHLQSVQRVGERVVHARRVRPQSARARRPSVAGRLPGLPARGGVSHADLEHRHRRRARSVAARADPRDAGHHRLRAEGARSHRAAAPARRRCGPRRLRAGHAGRAISRDAAAARARARADAPRARGACRPPAERGRAAGIRARRADAADGRAGEPAVVAGAAAAGHPRRGSAAGTARARTSASPRPISIRRSR